MQCSTLAKQDCNMRCRQLTQIPLSTNSNHQLLISVLRCDSPAARSCRSVQRPRAIVLCDTKFAWPDAKGRLCDFVAMVPAACRARLACTLCVRAPLVLSSSACSPAVPWRSPSCSSAPPRGASFSCPGGALCPGGESVRRRSVAALGGSCFPSVRCFQSLVRVGSLRILKNHITSNHITSHQTRTMSDPCSPSVMAEFWW